VIDAGGNIGIFALWAATAAPQARIVSIEPHPASAQRLRNTLAANGLAEQVTLIQTALGGDGAPRWLQGSSDGPTTEFHFEATEPSAGTSIEVPCMTLEKVLEVSDFQEVDLLKIDIEGGEYETLLATPREVLCKIRRINVELHLPDEASVKSRAALFDHLREAGFRMQHYEPDAAGFGVAYLDRH
jgi:FkbM family methyltransferase